MELTRVSRITAGAIGEPGARTFYVQAREGDKLVTLLVEKQQVAALAELIEQLIVRLESEGVADPGRGTDTDVPEDLGLEEPLEPEFRVGRIALGFDPERDLFLVQCEPWSEEDEEEADELSLEDIEDLEDVETLEDLLAEGSPESVRIWVNRQQLTELARVGTESVEAGRPACLLCGNPIDPDGHFCPGGNGHKEGVELR